MKLHYYADTDPLYIEFREIPGVESREVVDGLVVDLDGNGEVVGIDIEHASARLDLAVVETDSFPAATKIRIG